ncbi:ATP-binding protein [Candidatus Woesearchaeota archaeon]|nr:ATP-binding protein [Candidatus Woesearchaeota archaeon]
MFSYINPVYTDFHYVVASQRNEIEDILSNLVQAFNGVMPAVEYKKQVELCIWDRKNRPEKPRLAVYWQLDHLSEALYKRLEKIFSESVLDDDKLTSRNKYIRKRALPAKFVGFDGHSTGKIRGFPLYLDSNGIHDIYDLSREDKILWVAKSYSSVKSAKEQMKGRGDNYWFYSDGKFIIDLRLADCKEIEFIDTALRISVALNGSYDSFDRYKALSLAQKQLARRNKEQVRQEEVVGLEDLIEDIKFRQFFATIRPQEAKTLGVTNESVLLVGVPGTGKSSIASSLLWDNLLEDVVFIPLNVKELLEASYLSDKNMDTFFSGIRDLNRRYGFKPMLWCDDLEAAFLKDFGGSKEMAVAQSTLLNNLQGVSKDFGIRISGSTNNPEDIDPRFLEFGRISYMFHVPIPKEQAVIAKILSVHVEKRGQALADNVCIDEIAATSIGFTPRMLVNLVNEAGVQAARRIFGKFSSQQQTSEPLEVTADDYIKADAFIRARSDINIIARRDDEIAKFVEKHNKLKVGFQ